MDAQSLVRLGDYLGPLLDGAGGAPTVTPIAGGQSNPTYFLNFAPGGRYVLRKQPPGPLLPSAHAIDREYRVQAALAATSVPVARMFVYCPDPDIIGTPFYVMERLDGRVFHDNALPGLTPEDRAAVFDAMNATLAALHAVDPAVVGLADFGRPAGFFARQINRWTKQYEASRRVAVPALEKLASWLPAHTPSAERGGIVHGDYRLGNLMFHPSEPRVIGVLDWELATLGHPLADLGYNSMIWFNKPEEYHGLAGLDLAALGIPAHAEYAAAYERRARLGEALQPFHIAFSYFRLAVIFEGVAARAAQGNAVDARAGELGVFSTLFAERGCRIAGLG
ncbi:phosphotransferase family protein [Acidocella sp.]|uniref:phosphotransferase family protein n=1 Tax=Acidocella sp. TaxID=50710 RepID=UPI003D0858C0